MHSKAHDDSLALVPDERAELTRLSMVPRSGSQRANQAWMPEVVTVATAPISLGRVEGHISVGRKQNGSTINILLFTVYTLTFEETLFTLYLPKIAATTTWH